MKEFPGLVRSNQLKAIDFEETIIALLNGLNGFDTRANAQVDISFVLSVILSSVHVKRLVSQFIPVLF